MSTVEDRLAVRELYGRYAVASAKRNLDEWPASWASDARWKTPHFEIAGHDQLRTQWAGSAYPTANRTKRLLGTPIWGYSQQGNSLISRRLSAPRGAKQSFAMPTIRFRVNGQLQALDADPATPLLWVLRDHLGLTGTKFGCGIAQCGACTVHLNGEAIRSCQVPLESIEGMEIDTIEGLAARGGDTLQQLWNELNVPQCGYCQAGMLMAAADLLKKKPSPTDADIDEAITNICRCGTYPRVRAAIHRAAAKA